MIFFSTKYKNNVNSKIRFNLKNNKYIFEWFHNDLVFKTTIEKCNNQNINCNISFYHDNKFLFIENLKNSNLENILDLYYSDILSFLKNYDIMKFDFSINNFINIIFKRKKSEIATLNKKNISTTFNGKLHSKIITISSISSDYLNYIPEELISERKSVFLFFHNINLRMINLLQIIFIKKIFLLLNLIIKLIRIVSIFLASVGIIIPSLAIIYQLNFDPNYIIILISVSISSMLLFFFSSLLKSKIFKIVLSHFLL